MYDAQALKKIKGLNIKDFDGYLNEQGYKEDYLRMLEDETISEDGRSFDYSGQYSPSLASERLKLQYLTNYINNQVERNVEGQILTYQLENNGKNPSFDGVEISFSSGVDDNQLSEYIEKELPIITSKLKQRDVKNEQLYQDMKNGDVKGVGQAFKQGWRSLEDRINSFSAGTYDYIGLDSVADEVRMSQAETELEREDFMRYTYASGKEKYINGTTYLIDDKGQIYDKDLGIKVTNVLSPSESKYIRKEVGKSGEKSYTFSGAGMIIQGTGIVTDMMWQIALTRGVGILGRGGAAFLGAKKASVGAKALDFMSKIPMKATTASAMVAQGTLFSTNLAEQSYRQALDAGMSIAQAEEIQSIAGAQGLALGVITAPISTQTYAMDKIFGKNAKDVLLKGALNAYKEAGAKGAKAYWSKTLEKAGRYSLESGKEVVQENVQQGGQAYVIGDNVNEFAGKEIMADTISGDEFKNTTILSAFAGLIMPFGGQLVSNTKTSFNKRFRPGVAAIDKMNALYHLSKDVDKTTNLLNSQVDKGLYTEEQVKTILEDIDVYRNTINSIPTNLSPETALNVMRNIGEIKKQEELKSQLDPSFHLGIDAKIQDLRNEIIKQTNFDYLDNKAKTKLKSEAIRELSEEAEERGEKDYTIDDSQATFRAVENFNNLSLEERRKLAKIKPVDKTKASPDVEEEEEVIEEEKSIKKNTAYQEIESLTKELEALEEEVENQEKIYDGKFDLDWTIFTDFTGKKAIKKLEENVEKVSNLRNKIRKKRLELYLKNKTPEDASKRQQLGDEMFSAFEEYEEFRKKENKTKEEEIELNRLKMILDDSNEAFNNFIESVAKRDSPTKQKQDAISKPSTEEQVLQDAPTSTEGGKDSEVELRQVGEGDVEQVTPGAQVEEGDTQTDTTSDKTAQTDTEQLDVSFDLSDLESDIKKADKEGTLLDNLEKKAYSNGKEGMIRVDKENQNTLVFETNDEIIVLGRKDEIGENTLASVDITLMPPEGVDVAPVGTTKKVKPISKKKSKQEEEVRTLDVFTVDGVDYKIIGRRRDKKGKAVVRVKEVESGLERRLIGEKAERILKDEALRKEKKPQEIKLTVEGKETVKPVVKKKSKKEAQEEYDKKTLAEVEAMEKQSEEDVVAFEEMAIEDAVSKSSNTDIVQVGEEATQENQTEVEKTEDNLIFLKPSKKHKTAFDNGTLSEKETKQIIAYAIDKKLSGGKETLFENTLIAETDAETVIDIRLLIEDIRTRERQRQETEQEKKDLRDFINNDTKKPATKPKNGGKIFQVTKKKDGSFSVSQMRDDGKLIPVKDESSRKKAIEIFKSKKSNEERIAITEAEELINNFKSQEQDKILNFLDKAISATSNNGRAFDATLGIPMFAANSSLKIVRASYKAGKTILQAIQDALESLRNQGYNPNEYDYKQYVLNQLKNKQDTTSDKTAQTGTEQVTQPASTEEGMSVNKSPSVNKILGKKRTKVTVDEYSALKTQIKLEARAAREAVQDLKKKRKAVNNIVKLFSDKRKGIISSKKLQAVLNKSEKTNFYTDKSVDEFLDYMEKVFNDAEHIVKEKNAITVQSKIKSAINKKTNNDLRASALAFLKINPRTVKDIDAYLSNANNVLNGLKPTKVSKKDGKVSLKQSSPFNIQEVNSYTSKEKDLEEQRSLDRARKYFEKVTGLDSSKMTLEEMQELYTETESKEVDNIEIEKRKKEINKALSQAFNDAKNNLKNNTLTNSNKSDLNELLKLDFDSFNTKTKMQLLDVLINFNANGTLSGARTLIAKSKGSQNVKSLVKRGITSVKSSGFFGRGRNKNLTTLNLIFELMFKGEKKAGIVMDAIGLTSIINGASDAQKKIDVFVKKYADKFKNKKTKKGKYLDTYNSTERATLAESRRIEVNSDFSEEQQFENTKSLLKESYETLLSSENKIERELGKVYKEAYDKIIKNSSSISEVESKSDPANLEGVKYFTEEWAKYYQAISDTQTSIYNSKLGQDINYTPRGYTIIDPELSQKASDNVDLEKPLFTIPSRTNPYDKQSSVLFKANRTGKLPSGRVLNLSFETNNINKLRAALMDVNTAEGIRQVQGAFDSSSFNELFPNRDSRNLIKKRVAKYIDLKRGKKPSTEAERKQLRVLNKVAAAGVARALGGPTQAIKQMVPFTNTIVNAGLPVTIQAVDVMMSEEGNKIINESGMPIANRGIQSQSDIDSLNSLIQRKAKTWAGKGIDTVDKLNKMYLEVFLVKSDVMTARTSFLAFYIQAMNRKGVSFSDIDWTKSLDQDAMNTAQRKVDRQQNTSDPDLQGDLFTSQDLSTQVVRKSLFGFANFLINQKNRMYSDVSTLFYNPTALKGEKTTAMRSLAGLGVETASFNLLGYFLSNGLASIVASFMGGETPEEEEKRKGYQKTGRIGSAIADIVSPLPVLNDTSIAIVNDVVALFEDGEEEGDPFRFFAKEKKTLLEQMGVLGIAPAKAAKAYEMIELYRTGVAKNEYMGKKSTAEISEEARKKMGTVAMIYILTQLGVGTSEMNYMAERSLKLAKKTRNPKPVKVDQPKKTKTKKIKSSFKSPSSQFGSNKTKSFNNSSFGN